MSSSPSHIDAYKEENNIEDDGEAVLRAVSSFHFDLFSGLKPDELLMQCGVLAAMSRKQIIDILDEFLSSRDDNNYMTKILYDEYEYINKTYGDDQSAAINELGEAFDEDEKIDIVPEVFGEHADEATEIFDTPEAQLHMAIAKIIGKKVSDLLSRTIDFCGEQDQSDTIGQTIN